MISFTVPGRPVPKLRHRVRLYGGLSQFYTPKRVREYEEHVGWCARAAGVQPLPGPVAVRVIIYLARGRPEGDTDNYLKSILDGLNGIAWKDDQQVEILIARKVMGVPEEAQRVEVAIRKIRHRGGGA